MNTSSSLWTKSWTGCSLMLQKVMELATLSGNGRAKAKKTESLYPSCSQRMLPWWRTSKLWMSMFLLRSHWFLSAYFQAIFLVEDSAHVNLLTVGLSPLQIWLHSSAEIKMCGLTFSQLHTTRWQPPCPTILEKKCTSPKRINNLKQFSKSTTLRFLWSSDSRIALQPTNKNINKDFAGTFPPLLFCGEFSIKSNKLWIGENILEHTCFRVKGERGTVMFTFRVSLSDTNSTLNVLHAARV